LGPTSFTLVWVAGGFFGLVEVDWAKDGLKDTPQNNKTKAIEEVFKNPTRFTIILWKMVGF
jgi:hypothetical protein